MMDLRSVSFLRLMPWTTTLVLTLAATGCDDEVGKRYPVSGRVLLNGVPLQGKVGSVLFKPDAAKGNTSTFEAVGEIDAEGNYTLFTKGKKGAPRGWYKVVIAAGEPGQMNAANRTAGKPRNAPPPVISPRYAQEATSGLTVEVVADPAADAYDLQLTK